MVTLDVGLVSRHEVTFNRKYVVTFKFPGLKVDDVAWATLDHVLLFSDDCHWYVYTPFPLATDALANGEGAVPAQMV